MATQACRDFVENAWRKELCKNCQRPQNEHPAKTSRYSAKYSASKSVTSLRSSVTAGGGKLSSEKLKTLNINGRKEQFSSRQSSTDSDTSDTKAGISSSGKTSRSTCTTSPSSVTLRQKSLTSSRERLTAGGSSSPKLQPASIASVPRTGVINKEVKTRSTASPVDSRRKLGTDSDSLATSETYKTSLDNARHYFALKELRSLGLKNGPTDKEAKSASVSFSNGSTVVNESDNKSSPVENPTPVRRVTCSPKATRRTLNKQPAVSAIQSTDEALSINQNKDRSKIRGVLRKADSKSKNANVVFSEQRHTIISHDGGQENLLDNDIEAVEVSSSQADSEITFGDGEKLFALLALENTLWNSDLNNLKAESLSGSFVERKKKREASKEFEDVELESLWKPERFSSLIKNCESPTSSPGSELKIGTFPLTRRSPPLRTSLQQIFPENKIRLSSKESENSAGWTIKITGRSTTTYDSSGSKTETNSISMDTDTESSSGAGTSYKTPPSSSREMSPALSASSRTSFSSTMSDYNAGVSVEPYRVKQDSKPKVTSAYKVIELHPDPTPKPYGIVDVTTVPYSYPAPDLPRTPAPTDEKSQPKPYPKARKSILDNASLTSSLIETGSIGSDDEFGIKFQSSDFSLMSEILNDYAGTSEIKAAYKLLDEVFEKKDSSKINPDEITSEKVSFQTSSPKNARAMKPSTTKPKPSDNKPVVINPKPIKDSKIGANSNVGSSVDPAPSITDTSLYAGGLSRSPAARASTGKSVAFESNKSSVAANLDLSKGRMGPGGKRLAPSVPPPLPPPDPPKDHPKSPTPTKASSTLTLSSSSSSDDPNPNSDATNISQTPDPTFRFVKVGMIPNSKNADDKTDFKDNSGMINVPLPEAPDMSKAKTVDTSKKGSGNGTNGGGSGGGIMGFFSKMLRRGKESDTVGEIQLNPAECTVKLQQPGATDLDKVDWKDSSSCESTLSAQESSTKPKTSPKIASKTTHKVLPPKIPLISENKILTAVTLQGHGNEESSDSPNVSDKESSVSKIEQSSKGSSSIKSSESMVKKEEKSVSPSRRVEKLSQETQSSSNVSPKSQASVVINKSVLSSSAAAPPAIPQTEPIVVRRRTKSPKREAPKVAENTKNVQFARELEIRLSKGNIDSKMTRKSQAPVAPMSPDSRSPPSSPEHCSVEGGMTLGLVTEDGRPLSMPDCIAPSTVPGSGQDAIREELYLPPWESSKWEAKITEKIELPQCQKGRRSILGRISNPKKGRPPPPPSAPPAAGKASVKRAKSITEPSADGKRIDVSDISGPIHVNMTRSTKDVVNRRNTISIGDDSAFASGGSSSQDSGSGSVSGSGDQPQPVYPMTAPLTPLTPSENVYEPILEPDNRKPATPNSSVSASMNAPPPPPPPPPPAAAVAAAVASVKRKASTLPLPQAGNTGSEGYLEPVTSRPGTGSDPTLPGSSVKPNPVPNSLPISNANTTITKNISNSKTLVKESAVDKKGSASNMSDDSLEEQRTRFLSQQPIYEEIPNGNSKGLYSPKKENKVLHATVSARKAETVTANNTAGGVLKMGSPKLLTKSQTLPRQATRNGQHQGPTFPADPDPLKKSPPAIPQTVPNRPKPVPRRKLQRPSRVFSDQYVAMNRPGTLTKGYPEETVREHFNIITAANFDTLQQILKDFEAMLVHCTSLSLRRNVQFSDFKLLSREPCYTSSDYCVFQGTIPVIKEAGNVYFMVFPSSQFDGCPELAHVTWLKIITKFDDNVPTEILSQTFLQQLRKCGKTKTSNSKYLNLHAVLLKYSSVEPLNTYFNSFADVGSLVYFHGFLFTLVQVLSAFLYCLERGYCVAEMSSQDLCIVSLDMLCGKFLAILPKVTLLLQSNSSAPSLMTSSVTSLSAAMATPATSPTPTAASQAKIICSNAKRILQELVLSFVPIEQSFPEKYESAMGKVTDLIEQEQIESLALGRALLEFMLWGPSGQKLDNIMNSTAQEQALDLWLEVERANLLNRFSRASFVQNLMISMEDLFTLKFLLKSNGNTLLEVARKLWAK